MNVLRKRLFLVGVAALFLATGAAHAQIIPKYSGEDWLSTSGIAPYGYDPNSGWGLGYGTSGYDWAKDCNDCDGSYAEAPSDLKPIAFRPWRQIWQCNDIRILEFSDRLGLVEYDLSGTISGGSRFARALNRDMLFFNGRSCLKVAR